MDWRLRCCKGQCKEPGRQYRGLPAFVARSILSVNSPDTFRFLTFYVTYIVDNEAFLLLNISNGGGDRDVMRQLIKVTE